MDSNTQYRQYLYKSEVSMSLCSFEKMNYKDCQISYNVQVNTDWGSVSVGLFCI